MQNVSKEYRKVQFPERWPYDRSIDFLLNEEFWSSDDEILASGIIIYAKVICGGSSQSL